MTADDLNEIPLYAKLPGGMSMQDIGTAIEISGYPLQADVQNTISSTIRKFDWLVPSYQEEWTYFDADTDDVRSIDIFANLSCVEKIDSRTGERLAYDSPEEHDFHLEYGPAVTLFIECKQSELPFIFFLRNNSPSEMNDFPEMAGIASTDILTYSQWGGEEIENFAVYMTAHDILGLYELPFFNKPDHYAVSISKIARRGKSIELTGEEAYRSLTLPLLKAAHHYKQLREPTLRDTYGRVEFLICLAVVRAPMLGSALKNGKPDLTPIPWARSWRVEPRPPSENMSFVSSHAIRYMDVVHESYLPDYLSMLVHDFQIVNQRLKTIEPVLIEGRGVSVFPGGHNGLDDNEPHQSTRPLTADEKRRLDHASEGTKASESSENQEPNTDS